MTTNTTDSEQPANPGQRMWAEIAEQPAIWRRGLAERGRLSPVAAAIRDAAPRFVLFLARGTSDHAAYYAKYLVETLIEAPAGMVSPSTMTVYGAQPDLRDVLVIAISQSGRSPDLVHSLRTSRERGALTLAVTNDPASPLAEAAELHVDVLAGPERAVAATKSYTAQLLSLYLLVDALRGGDGVAAEALPEAGDLLLAQAGQVRRIAQRYRFDSRLVITGRGYATATAHEFALKMMETSYVSAQAFSAADLLHGPIAMLDSGATAVAIVPEGAGGDAASEALARIRASGAYLLCVGRAAAVAEADAGIELPTGLAEEVSPVVEILPLQLLAREVAIGQGHDPDTPRGLHKVTETR